MSHPLEDVMRTAERFVLIGDSSQERFPGQSFHCYAHSGRPFYCLDLGGLEVSRGPSAGQRVYARPEDVPSDHGDLALIWVKPRSAAHAVEVAHGLGCRRVWFSFQTGHRDAVHRARELGLEVVEIGRCPVYYTEKQVPMCRAHTLWVQASGTYRKPPQTEADAKHREIW